MGDKVVVIGGSGYIGSHVSDCLSEHGYDVTVYDSKESKWLRNNQRMVIGDITDWEKLDKVISGARYVYNFAAIADLNDAVNNPIGTIEINILGNAYVMEACKNHNIERFVYASSVYVNSKEGGFYRCSKQACENYVEEYYKKYGLEYTILRYGSLYGPRADESNGMYRIIRSALDDGFIRYEGDMNAMREYIHVYDAAEASVEILKEKYISENMVLTGQEAMPVIELLRIVAEIMSQPESSVQFVEAEYAGHYVRTPYNYKPNIGRKYIPPHHVDLGQGLLDLIEEMDSNSGNG